MLCLEEQVALDYVTIDFISYVLGTKAMLRLRNYVATYIGS